jgi:hypothetical protein
LKNVFVEYNWFKMWIFHSQFCIRLYQ